MSGKKKRKFIDHRGVEINQGDKVLRVAIDAGAPAEVVEGKVVGFGRTRVYVQWGMTSYDDRFPHHAVRTELLGDRREAYALRVNRTPVLKN